MNKFKTDIIDYICSGHALLHIDTFEKDRAISEIAEVAESSDRQVYVWSIARGWIDINGKKVCEGVKPSAPIYEQVQAILGFPENVICVLRDFGPYMKHDTYPNYDVVIGWLDELRKLIASVSQTIIFVGPDFHIPKQLLHDITQIEFSLPDDEQIKERIEFSCSYVTNIDGSKFELDQDVVPKLIGACKGMTSSEIVDRVTLVLRKHKNLGDDALKSLMWEKTSIIRASGLLQYIEPPSGGLGNVGGYDALKRHVLLDKPCFTDEARKFGINYPKGMLFAGIPGCGKTLLATAIASEMGMPLISMDIGQLMNKYVGESESNMKSAIKMIESVSPVVILLDEIEKSFGGSSDFDGGSSRRVFGSFLSWMNDRTSPVYLIATANRVKSLPIEFTRAGRFDAIFALDLPHTEERSEIFSIHLKKKSRQPANFDLTILSESTEGYTGSDIENVVGLSLKIAFSEHKELEIQHLQRAIMETIPLSKTNGEQIEEIRQWCTLHAKAANPARKYKGNRKVILGEMLKDSPRYNTKNN